MVPEPSRIYERLEALERSSERHTALIEELQRRMDGVEGMREDLRRLEQTLTRLEGRLEALLARTSTWQTLVWAILGLLLGGVVAAGFELFKR
ncbi:hypothetical protein [Thermus brockianus]|uniref:DUF2203 domain-containing protein n=1 Tax=Thermus brockianus TaxID=56956 RepID=A0ABM7XKT7_THEBO|nr:hypothetical protein [Thermus brockianus]BDG16934.1 hypothetical protein TbrSNM41_16680 [Thermus brockianus]